MVTSGYYNKTIKEKRSKGVEKMKPRKWLSELRKTQGLSQFQVAERAGIARPMYSFLESGDKNPSVTTAKKVAEVLGFNWIIFFENQGNL